MGSSGVMGIACGCGRNLMLAAFQFAHISCTQRQRGGAAERGEAHVGGRGAVGSSGVVGLASGSGRNVMVAVVERPWTSCHVYGHMNCIPVGEK